MRAAWWWIDRWRKSTAYTDMTAEQQGVYRNMLDELWLRDGLLPLSEKALAQISGDHDAWPRVREAVLRRFVRTPEGYRNETHDKIMAAAKKNAEKQARYRDRLKGTSGNVTRNGDRNVTGPPSPSPKENRRRRAARLDGAAPPSPEDDLLLERATRVGCAKSLARELLGQDRDRFLGALKAAEDGKGSVKEAFFA